MTSDLEQELRQNLKLRRELGGEVARATDSSAKQGRWDILPLGLDSLLGWLGHRRGLVSVYGLVHFEGRR